MTEPRRVYEFGPFSLDAVERVLRRDGEPVALTPKAIDTLILLVQRSGHIVDKSELMATVWPDTFVGEDSLTRNVSTLRKVLNGYGEGELIETVARRGYRFRAALRELPMADGQLVVARRTRIRIVSESNADDGHDGVEPGVARSLAVLPFMTLDATDSELYLGPGLADALITKLASVRRIAVRPTSAILKYAASDVDPFEAGKALRVESVLSGTIQRLGDRIRITTQLTNVAAETVFWGETFDQPFTDIFAVEDSISEQVVSALMLTLTGEEHRLLAKHHTNNPETYRWILRGRHFWNKGAGEWFGKAVESFQQAVATDPNDPVAHVGLADCFNMLGFWGNVPSTQAFPSAIASATTALALDESLAEAHTALAWATVHYHYDRAAAERTFARSLNLNPSALLARQWWALFLAQEGRFEEAITEVNRAYELDPLNLHTNYNLGVILMLARRDDEAIEQFLKTIELDPGYLMAHSHLGFTYGLKGMREPAMAAQAEVGRLAKDVLGLRITGWALLDAMFGARDAAHTGLQEAVELATSALVFPTAIAQIHSQLAENDHAMRLLERAYEERDPWLVWLKVNPCFDPIRDDPRFVDLMKRVGLTP